VALAAAIERSGRPVLVVATRADLQVEWPAIVAADEEALAEIGVSVPVIAVSSPLRREAIDRGDDALNQESGFDRVVAWLDDDVVVPIAALRRRRVTTEGGGVVASLLERARAERVGLQGGDAADEVVRSLEGRAKQVQAGAARWGQELTDVMADLRSAVEVDLRNRAVTLVADAEARIDNEDPAEMWEAFGGWIEEQALIAMTEHLAWRHERFVAAIDRSTASFGDLLALSTTDVLPAADDSSADGVALSGAPKRVSTGTSLYGVLKNSYGGLAMFGFFGGVAGIVLSAPVTVGVGLLLGAKGLREERIKQLAQRRSAAKTSARAYVEASWTRFTADARAQLVQLQRAVRDEMTVGVNRVREDTRQAYEAAKAASATEAADRAWRTSVIDGEIAALDELAARVTALGALPQSELAR